jgi:hypothetical protein
MSLLRGILAGPQAPTWIVVRGASARLRLESEDVWPVVDTRYQLVGTVCGRSIYLRRGLDRPPLKVSGHCGGLVLP